MSTDSNRLMVACIAVLLGAPSLAGCLGTAQASMMETQDTAEDRANEWAQSAQLVEAVGIEGALGGFGGMVDADASASHWDRAQDDPDIGDGYAELWMYRYVSEAKPDTIFTVVVDRDDEIVATDKEERDPDENPIGDWSVDSDEAAEIAMDENDGLREGTSSEHFGLVMHLGDDEDYENPIWSIVGGGGDGSGGGGGIVIVDAVTGEVLVSQGGSGSWGS